MNVRIFVSCVLLSIAATGVARADSVPHTFTNGGVIDANAVNENFTAVALPVGTVVTSLLTEAQYQSASGSNWVLADGRDVSGSAFATLTGNTALPDLRGVFLRGRNNGRADGNQNPDGEIALGGYQADEVKSHGHGVSDSGHTHSLTRVSSTGTTIYNGSGNAVGVLTGGTITSDVNTSLANISIHGAGGAESRPRNVTVNYFIKID